MTRFNVTVQASKRQWFNEVDPSMRVVAGDEQKYTAPEYNVVQSPQSTP